MEMSLPRNPLLTSPWVGEGLQQWIGGDCASASMPLLPLQGGGWVGVATLTILTVSSPAPGAIL